MSTAPRPPRWQIWADTGGTFTDCVGRAPDGVSHRVKVPSSGVVRAEVTDRSSPDVLSIAPVESLPPGPLPGWRLRVGTQEVSVASYDPTDGVVRLAEPLTDVAAAGDPVELLSPEPAPVLGARLLTGTGAGARLPPLELRLATTRGTNALLERKGAPTALFVTRGFGDLLRIGDQRRADLFALDLRRPPPLVDVVVEVEERLAADGTVLEPLVEGELISRARAQRSRGLRAAAVSLLHGARYPAHEERVAALLAEVGFDHVSTGCALSAELGFLARTQTAVVDATLSSVLAEYFAAIDEAIGGSGFLTMTSAGGLADSAICRPKDCLLSGPAGGVVGAAAAAAASGVDPVLSFDMGGTSTDVARIAKGQLAYRFTHRVGDAELRAAAVAIETVAAGGGSICGFDGHRLQVGPESAGADPGPACYGGGGPLTLTDVDLLLGRLDPRRFAVPLWPEQAAAALRLLAERIAVESGEETGAEALLWGWLRIADERMAEAIREVSVRRGFATEEHTLLAFGGAGGQHVCGVAERLGIRRALVPADASVLSAVGLGAARLEEIAERQVLAPLPLVAGHLAAWTEELEVACRRTLEHRSTAPLRIDRRLLEVRLTGQETRLQLDWQPGEDVAATFERGYRAQYGYAPPDRPLEVVMLRVVVSAGPEAPPPLPAPEDLRRVGAPPSHRAWFGDWTEVPLFEWENLRPGDCALGPALVVDAHTTVTLPPGWGFVVDGGRSLVLARRDEEGGG